MKLGRNLGTIDRAIRFVIGIAGMVLGLVFKTWWGAIGAFILATALIGWCPLYAPFRLCTYRPKSGPGR